MQSEFFDKKIKEAADHHHPAYDEQAWKQMHKLLDKHMPEKENNRRRFLFFILFFLLLGGGLTWFLTGRQSAVDNQQIIENRQETSGNKQSVPTDQQRSTSNQQPITNNPVRPVQPVGQQQATGNPQLSNGSQQLSVVNRQSSVSSNTNLLRRNRRDPLARAIINSQPSVLSQQPTDNKQQAIGNGQSPAVNPQSTVVSPQSSVVSQQQATDNKQQSIGNRQSTASNPQSTAVSQQQVNNNPQPEKKEQTKSKKPSSIFFSLSGGPDISFTEPGDMGKTEFLGGIGAGFTWRDRFTIRTGFYSSSKVYSATKEDYNPPADFWNYYPYMEKIDANCKIYEIPVLLTYNFGKSDKQKWMATTGLSSYLMKRETYDYYYKYTPTSNVYHRQYTIRDRNEHYFSVLTLSGGYKRNFGRVSVMAEPYMKVPLAGVGFGKVKLNSGGILFTASFTPFVIKPKQKNNP